MKHDLSVTIVLIGIFVLSQLVGLFLVAGSVKGVDCSVNSSVSASSCKVSYSDSAVGSRPETSGFGSLLYIIIGVAIGTVALLIMARFDTGKLWKAWFFLAVWFSITAALGVLVSPLIAWVVAFLLSAWKIFKPNIYVYNLAEVLMYAGIAVLFVPILNVFWMIVLLLLISVYDFIAVWKSKHMVTMAKFISGNNAFAGLLIPYSSGRNGRIFSVFPSSKSGRGKRVKQAILGGGDITFPLLFSGVVFQQRLSSLVAKGFSLSSAVHLALIPALIVTLGAVLAVAYLLFFAKKNKFYPAMPYITAGCLLFWLVSLLV